MSQTQKVLFEESQRFRQWWVWLILLPINILWVAAIYQQVLQGVPFGDNPMPDAGLYILAGTCVMVSFLILSCHLKTQVTAEGIRVRFFPFQWAYREYRWDQLTACYIRKYNPIGEYGGWGYRIGLFGKGMALNVSGSMGLQLEFDKKKLLIGTRRPDVLDALLLQLGVLRKPEI